jgi:glycosyltransferase involved in cell wall biosynthesis
MSQHEGFMVPVIEAFAAGCPVIARNAGAVGDTMPCAQSRCATIAKPG